MQWRTLGRILATVISATASVGLAVQFVLSCRTNGSVSGALWVILAYFTITTNILVAVVFAYVAANRRAVCAEWMVAGTMLSILLVGIVYALLLQGLQELSGGSLLVDRLLHFVTPTLAPLYWILFERKGTLSWRVPLLWAVYPLAYLVYALARGAATGKYAYPFLDVTALGWQKTGLNAAIIAASFMVAGYALVWIDHRKGRART